MVPSCKPRAATKHRHYATQHYFELANRYFVLSKHANIMWYIHVYFHINILLLFGVHRRTSTVECILLLRIS